MNFFNEQKMASMESSAEIMESISAVASSESEAMEIWADPKCKKAKIITMAWELADIDESELFWGDETITRNA